MIVMTRRPIDLDTLTIDAIRDGALRDRPVTVLGLARSGLALARFFTDAGAHVTVYDGRPADELATAIADLEGSLKSADKAEIDAKVAALMTASQKLGEKMYADQQAQQQAAGGGAEGGQQPGGSDAGGAKQDDVVDADFKEVKDAK